MQSLKSNKVSLSKKLEFGSLIGRVSQGTLRQGGLTRKIFKFRGGGVNSSDLMHNFWRSPQNFV
jgi:hypothetical protein